MNNLNFLIFTFLLLPFTFSACGSGSSSGDNTDALAYAKFGETMDNTIPAGLKSGGANSDIVAIIDKTLSGDCLTNYTSCSAMTAAGGSDNQAAEILMRLWALDYHSECTSAFYQDGTCFQCDGCTDNVAAETFIKPTMISSPASCGTIATTAGRYVNFQIDPCFFDTIIGQISNIKACETVAGGAVDISSAVPWYASWGLPQTVNFSSLYAYSNGGGMWWTVNHGHNGNGQYFLSLNSDWLNFGIKDITNDNFMFFGTGSPAYYVSIGETSGVNIAAYTGTLSTIPAKFEAMQVRVQGSFNYIERLTSNGSYLWYQEWTGNDFPSTSAAVAGVKDSPTGNRCVQIGTSVVNSKYVPFTDCVTSFATTFGVTSVNELNADANYTLKVIDGETASAISFSTSLTPTVTSTSCLPEATQ